jgi:hypothetical protein
MVDGDKMMFELKAIDTEMAAYAVAMRHADDATFEVMASHVNELFRKRCRAMGLPEEEIARVERESETATAQEIAHTMTCGVVPTAES